MWSGLVCTCVSVGSYRIQKNMLDPLELKLDSTCWALLWKNIKYSWLLSHLSSPKLFLFDVWLANMSFTRFILFFSYVGGLCSLVQVPTEVRKGHWIVWSWSCRLLWTTLHGCWDLNSVPFQKSGHHQLLNHFSKLQPCIFFLPHIILANDWEKKS